MNNLVFIDDPDDPFIHQIQEKFDNIQLEDDEIPHDKTILSIDIGIRHLGISVGYVDKSWKLIEITWVTMIDITKFSHDYVLKDCKCPLHHTRSMADWLEHVFIDYEPVFKEVDHILLERQPLAGLVAIEQLIYYRWREKCHLISPRSMHKHFCIGSYDYDTRKQKTMEIAEKKFYWHPRAIEWYKSYERRHDIADSICLMAFWLAKRHQAYIEKKHREEINNLKLTAFDFQNIDDWFAQFRYTPY